MKLSRFHSSSDRRQPKPDRRMGKGLECGGAANQQLCTARRAKQRVNSKEKKKNNNRKNNE